MAYRPLRSAPTEYPVAQHDFHAFGLALYAAVELVEILKYLHRRPRGSLVIRPLVSMCLPLLNCRHSFGITPKPHSHNASCGRLVPGFERRHFLEGILPTGCKPRLDQRGRCW